MAAAWHLQASAQQLPRPQHHSHLCSQAPDQRQPCHSPLKALLCCQALGASVCAARNQRSRRQRSQRQLRALTAQCLSSQAAGVSDALSAQHAAAGVSEAPVRPISHVDYWAVADLHTDCFYPRASLCGPLFRMDRVLALQVGFGSARRLQKAGFECLVACAAGRRPQPLQVTLDGLAAAFKLLLPQPLQEGFGVNAPAAGLLGTIVVDSFGQHVPSEVYYIAPDGTRTRIPRFGTAYISNLAVAAGARRGGVGERLLHQAELVAEGWGCRSIMLHCDPANIPAYNLYLKNGYKLAADAPKWQPFLEVRPGVQLDLMMKPLQPQQ